MRVAQRRIVGVGGAAAVAIGATLAFAGIASAHTPSATPGCAKDGKASITIGATNYATNGSDKTPNTITVDVDGKNVPDDTFKFGVNFSKVVEIEDGTKPHDVAVHFAAFDDPDGKKGFTKTLPLHTTVCSEGTPTSPPSSTTTTTTTTTKPSESSVAPTTTTKAVVPPPPVTTTTKAATAAAELPNTGVSAGVPLALGGALVVAGGGLLFYMRMSARRRHQN